MKILIAITLAAAAAAAMGGQGQPARYAQGPAAAAFIEHLQAKYGLEPEWVRERLAAAQRQPHILEIMRSPPEETLAWYEYRAIFMDEPRIAGGARYVRTHRELLQRAREHFGVPPHVIAAILGVETRYGEITGDYRVLDALATLGFDYPPRADFFRSELAEFLMLAREEGLDPTAVLGSYAGAMGVPQFIASSYRAYAVDFNGNGQRDLWHEPADVIGSVANYLAVHGWQAGEPVILRARTSADSIDLQRSQRHTRYPYSRLVAAGVEARSAQALSPDTPVGLVELETADGPRFWIGLKNFFVITDYNHSPLYAMAVYQLGEAIKQRLESNRTVAVE